MSDRHVLYFEGPRRVALRSEPMPQPGSGQLLVTTAVSAISAGTEKLIYRGLAPAEMAADETLPSLAGSLEYPLSYGYAAAGRVTVLGPDVDERWLGRRVFAFVPHQSHFLATLDQVLEVPADLSLETAVLLPSMETAVSLLMDGSPTIGEQVAVVGQGVVGLLTTHLLSLMPLRRLVAVDVLENRCAMALSFGANAVLEGDLPGALAWRTAVAQGSGYPGADLVYELSGQPDGLNLALALSGYHGRVVIGSWYGRRQTPLDLGGRFHRDHISLISSQVSRLKPGWSGRWTKGRRLEVAWAMLERLNPERLISHRLPLSAAVEAYARLDEDPTATLQVLFTYD